MLILRDVLGWPAKNVAELFGDSVNSVNNALQRACAGVREHLLDERQDWTGGEEDAGTRELVRRFTEASVATDIHGITTLLREDIRCSMPPTPGLYVDVTFEVPDDGERIPLAGFAVVTASSRPWASSSPPLSSACTSSPRP